MGKTLTFTEGPCSTRYLMLSNRILTGDPISLPILQVSKLLLIKYKLGFYYNICAHSTIPLTPTQGNVVKREEKGIKVTCKTEKKLY